MANQKYDQVIDMLAEGRLRWQTDEILAVLVKDGTFDKTDTVLSQVGTVQGVSSIQGRVVVPGGNFLGYAAFFSDIQADQEFQVVVVQQIGNGDPYTLAWYDTDENDDPIILQNTGTLVVRPALLDSQTPTDIVQSTTSRLWMRVP